MINISRLFLWLCLTFVASNCQQLLPLGSYHHEIAFPSITGEFRTSRISDDQKPVREISTGFHLDAPPPLPFFQSFPSPQVFSTGRNSFRGKTVPHGRPWGPLKPLFVPNAVRQRPESEGQEEEYRKYLKEEAEDLEKEKEQNDITTDFTDFAIDSTTSIQPVQKTYVRLNLHGKDYSYST